jgi:Carboxypeptidase regulatory-like domain/TonB dependent receptor-like, beta-barrel/TonB-dependent Receptor Plug Domain
MIDPLERGGAMKAERRLPAGVLLALGLAWGSATAFAQVTTATLLGTVSDSQGGVLAGAAVTATNLDTGLVRTVRTDPSGSYTMVNLPLGRYQAKAEAEGFKTKVVTDLSLVVDQKLRRDFSLEVGRISETVEVAGQATLLQTDQPDINQIVQEKEIRGLPLNGRDFFSLLLLSNGVQDTSNDQAGATTNVTFSVNGMRPESNSVTLDGVQMSSVRESDVDLRPNVDAIEEFKVLTSAYSAEYGHTGGGVISIQTKGGTNGFHGSAYEFLRNDAFNAANYFKNPVNPEKAPLRQNQFGVTLGGPIRKDKTFFFVDYQGQTLRKINEAFANVPEEPFRRGDFSSILPDNVVYDPETGQPFPGNIIPPSRFNSFGSAILDAAALPNLTGSPLGNYFVRQPQSVNQHEGGFRIDHALSRRDHMFVRFRMSNLHLDTADALARPDGPMPGISMEVADEGRGIQQGGIHDDRNYNAVLSHVHLFSPRLVNEARVGFHRYELDVLSHAHGQNLAEKFGLRGVNIDENTSGLPVFYLNAYTKLGGDDFKPLYFRETFWQFNDTLTYSLGQHSLKLGLEYRRRNEDNYYALFPAGAFYFYPMRTTNYTFVGSHELAEVLLGLPFLSFHGRRFSPPLLRDQQYSGFLQDDWKVSDHLTLNLGVRYEYYTPMYSPTNEVSMFDVDKGRIVKAGVDGESRYIIGPDRNNIAPRVGFAYKIDEKTTLRGGFGMFFTPENAKQDDIKFNPPFYLQYALFDQWMFDELPPPFTDPGPYPTGYETTNIERGFQRGYAEQYNLAFQRELPGRFLFEAAYVGSQAHKLPFVVNINQAQPDGTPAPFPDLGPVRVVRPTGDSVYHSGQFKLEKRFSEGLFVLATYTWSKSIDTVSSALFSTDVTGGVQNIFDPRANRGPSDWDVPHRFSLSYLYDIPFGKDRKYGKSAGSLARALFGDWQITGIFVARSGPPGTVTVGKPLPGGDARPDVLHDPNLPESERTPERWFDTTAFVANIGADGKPVAGNAGRNIIRGPGYVNFDLGLIKLIPINDRVRLQFRTEIFNLTNTPHFAMPVLKMSDPAFGRITHTRNPTNFGSTATSYANRMIQFALKLEF